MRRIILANVVGAALLAIAWTCYSRSGNAADEAPTPVPDASKLGTPPNPEHPEAGLSKDPPGMKRLLPDSDLWLDVKNKRVVMDGMVCLRDGQLEMFACLKGTKEHESVVSVKTKAYAVHAALIAIGAKPGTTVRFEPEYRPASGTTVDVTVIWTDAKGTERHEKAQNWIRNVKTGKPMEQTWVFAGSGFWEDPDTKEKHYQADGGDFICVSNFPSAMLDLPIESSQTDNSLMFRAFTENIPPRGTKIRLVLTPRLEKQGAPDTKESAKREVEQK